MAHEPWEAGPHRVAVESSCNRGPSLRAWSNRRAMAPYNVPTISGRACAVARTAAARFGAPELPGRARVICQCVTAHGGEPGAGARSR